MGGKQLLVIALVLLGAGLFFRGPFPPLAVRAEVLANLGGFLLTNTLIATWVTMVVVVLLLKKAATNMQMVPGGFQNLIEVLVEALSDFCATVAGAKYGKVFFPLIATIFVFVLGNSWLGLLPGYNTIGIIDTHGHEPATFQQMGPIGVLMPKFSALPLVSAPAAEHGAAPKADAHAPAAAAKAKVDDHGAPAAAKADEHGAPAAAAKPAEHAAAPAAPGTIQGELIGFLRPASTDLNTTIAVALFAMFFVEYWGFKYAGIGGYGSKFINFSGFKNGPMMGVIYFIIGIIELVSEVGRVVSFSFRLFGNMFAGEVLLTVIVFLLPWTLALPFYALEMFVGIVQSLVFAGLTLVFAASAVAGHGEGHGEGHDHGHEEGAHH